MGRLDGKVAVDRRRDERHRPANGGGSSSPRARPWVVVGTSRRRGRRGACGSARRAGVVRRRRRRRRTPGGGAHRRRGTRVSGASTASSTTPAIPGARGGVETLEPAQVDGGDGWCWWNGVLWGMKHAAADHARAGLGQHHQHRVDRRPARRPTAVSRSSTASPRRRSSTPPGAWPWSSHGTTWRVKLDLPRRDPPRASSARRSASATPKPRKNDRSARGRGSRRRSPSRTRGVPDDIAQAALYLASDEVALRHPPPTFSSTAAMIAGRSLGRDRGALGGAETRWSTPGG